jgi:hypothetical protein
MHRIGMFDVFVCYMHACMHRIGMFDIFVCYMHVLDVFEVIYMDIYVFAILKCRELMKKKTEKYWGFFAVHMRTAKDHLVTLPCAYARQRTHVALTCASWELGRYATMAFAVLAAARHTAKGTTTRTATQRAQQRDPARQRQKAHGNETQLGKGGKRTATLSPTAKNPGAR